MGSHSALGPKSWISPWVCCLRPSGPAEISRPLGGGFDCSAFWDGGSAKHVERLNRISPRYLRYPSCQPPLLFSVNRPGHRSWLFFSTQFDTRNTSRTEYPPNTKIKGPTFCLASRSPPSSLFSPVRISFAGLLLFQRSKIAPRPRTTSD